MKKILCGTVAILMIGCVNLSVSTQQLIDENQPWSVRMTESEILRNPESWQVDFSKKLKWSYCVGLELGAIWQVYERYGDERYRKYVISYADTVVQNNGNIHTYRLSDYNLDQLCSGRLLFDVYQYTKDDKYKKALALLRSQLDTQPRTAEGGFWHKKVYPHQMWLDGIYMGAPFYAEYALYNNCTDDYQDVIRQFTVIGKHTYDSVTGLYKHAWDESRQQKWANPITGQSAHCWGRALGWYAMALVDVLDFIPASEPGRDSLVAILQHVANRIEKYQDSSTGLWYQVVDRSGDKGNYLEASASSMYAYALMKGSRKGYLPKSFLKVGIKGYKGLLRHLVKVDGRGMVSLTQICEVAGLGGTKDYRMGDYDYYINERKKDNDAKGIGPFILASLEYEKCVY